MVSKVGPVIEKRETAEVAATFRGKSPTVMMVEIDVGSSDSWKTCYVCRTERDHKRRKGSVRDAKHMGILECQDCGLVSLETSTHINDKLYEDSGMHASHGYIPTMKEWLNNTAVDDQRRFEMLETSLTNKRVLDFGCGGAGFLLRAKETAKEVAGIELEKRVREHYADQFPIFASIEAAQEHVQKTGAGFDLVTAFHVVEHLPDPRATLSALSKLLAPGGTMVVEVPSGDDALLTLYDCDGFQNFSYWSQHLFLFNASTMNTVARQAGLRPVAIEQFQRYPLSNHLHWLSQQKPGGHAKWSFLDSPALYEAYAAALAKIGKCDTIIAYLKPE